MLWTLQRSLSSESFPKTFVRACDINRSSCEYILSAMFATHSLKIPSGVRLRFLSALPESKEWHNASKWYAQAETKVKADPLNCSLMNLMAVESNVSNLGHLKGTGSKPNKMYCTSVTWDIGENSQGLFPSRTSASHSGLITLRYSLDQALMQPDSVSGQMCFNTPCISPRPKWMMGTILPRDQTSFSKKLSTDAALCRSGGGLLVSLKHQTNVEKTKLVGTTLIRESSDMISSPSSIAMPGHNCEWISWISVSACLTLAVAFLASVVLYRDCAKSVTPHKACPLPSTV